MKTIEIYANSLDEAKAKLCPVVAYTLQDVMYCTIKQIKIFIFTIDKGAKNV